ncbi:MAG: nitrite reductase small subunit NirD [Acidobacteriota bacterium]|nr:nitrite reductase small subunit NirD [Blastocatellia bacterium]MDW8411579.1 nitrite reductase small subunit NirD [Acidobacteriota bacterium]
MIEFYPVCKFTDIGFAEGKAVEIEGKRIAIFNVFGKLYAIENVCPHMSATLHDGTVEGRSVICRLHFWEISLTDGKCITDPAYCVATFPVKVEKGIVKVGIEKS